MKYGDKTDLLRNNCGQFETTRWSLVIAAGNRETEESSRALEKRCRAYWPPLYAYIRRTASDVLEPQDLTQAFFARLLEREYLADANSDRGRDSGQLKSHSRGASAPLINLDNEWTSPEGMTVVRQDNEIFATDPQTGKKLWRSIVTISESYQARFFVVPREYRSTPLIVSTNGKMTVCREACPVDD